ncbi:MAG: urea transport system substrate-binding protein, partial [Bermanella sp.]
MKNTSNSALNSFMRRRFVKGMLAVPAAILLSGMSLTAIAGVNTTGLAVTDDTVTVGILHSLTGTMAISETGAQEAEKLAIKQINESGGILGRQIKIIQE